MPNVGRPSRDCHKCRQRRVKCDLRRPECQRCRKKGLLCPGYRDESETRFRIESVETFSSSMARDRRRTLTKGDTSLVTACYRSSQDTKYIKGTCALAYANRHFTISRSLQESWNHHVIPLIISKFSSESVYSSILHIVSKTDETSIIYKACSAVGWAYVTKTSSHANAAFHRTKAYGIALTAVNAALMDPRLCKADDTLMSVWLLGFYELIISTQDNIGPSGWDAHCYGMWELLRQRDKHSLKEKNKRNIFWIIFTTITFQVITTGRECPKESLVWIRKICDESNKSEHMMLRAAIFSYHCATICHRIQELINTNDADKLLSDCPSILQDVEVVEKITHPLSGPITEFVIDPPLKPYTMPDRVNVRSIRVELLRYAAKASGLKAQQKVIFDQLIQRSIQEFQTLANRILTVIPFMLGIEGPIDMFNQAKRLRNKDNLYSCIGWPDAGHIIWPLELIATCADSSQWQRDTATKILRSINPGIGII